MPANTTALEFIQGMRKSILKDESLVPQVDPNLVQLRTITHFRERMAFFFARLFPSPKGIIQVYTVSPFSLRVLVYYLKRLKTLGLRYGHLMWQLFRHDTETMNEVSRQTALIEWLIPPSSSQKHAKRRRTTTD